MNLLLASIALTQGAVVACLLLFESLPVPQWVVRQLDRELREEGLEAAWSRLSISFGGEVVLEDFELRERRTGQRVLRGKRLVGQLDLLAPLFGGPVPLESVRVAEAAIHGPPEITPRPDQPLAVVTALHLGFSPGEVQVRRGAGQLGQSSISLTGALPLGPSTEAAGVENWRSPWLRLSQALMLAQTRLAEAPGSSLSVRLDRPPGPRTAAAPTIAHLELAIPRLGLGEGRELQQVHGRAAITGLAPPEVRAPVELRADRLRLAGPESAAPSVHRLRLWLAGEPDTLGAWTLPGRAHAYFRVRSGRLPTARVSVELPLEKSAPSLPLHAKGRAQVADLRAKWTLGTALGEPAPIELGFTLEGDPDSLLRYPPLELPGLAEQLAFSPALRLSGQARWDRQRQFEAAELTVNARQFSVREADFDEVRARLFIDPERLLANPVAAFDPGGQEAHGAFVYHFDSRHTRVLAHGRTLPRRLDSLLPSFYRQLWESIDPGEHPVEADVDVRWIGGSGDQTVSLATARGRDLRYRGEAVEQFDLRLWQGPGFVDLMDLRAAAPQGRLDGEVALIFPRSEGEARRTRIDLHTHLPLPVLAAVLGEEAEVINARVSADPVPEVRLRGEIASHPDRPPSRNLAVEAEVRGRVTVAGLPLDWLQVQARVTDEGFTLKPFRLGLASGLLEGEATVELEAPGGGRISLRGALSDAEYTTVQRLAEQLASGPPEAPHPWDSLPPEARGRLDLTLAAQGELGRWDRYTGRGHLAVTGAPLGQIDLFGGLSRLFGSLGLNFTSFRLEDLQSELVLAPGLLGFPDLEIRGPSLAIESQGKLSVPDRGMAFDAKVFFLDTEHPSLRSLVGVLLRPLGHALEVRVEGELPEPEWTFRRNPLHLLREAPESAEPPSQTPDADPLTPEG